MFGTLPAPCRCQIGDQADLYRGTFCGLCNALASAYGQPARLLVNRDSTFVALLAAAQAPETPLAALSTRCQPWSRAVPVFETGPAPAFAAAVTLCGLQAKLDDERADESGFRAAGSRLLCALSRARFGHAGAILSDSGFPVAEVRRRLAGQSRVETDVARGGDPWAAAQPSAQAFGAILAHTARLTGRDANVAPLAQVGRSLGELVYTLDAYEDLADDLRRGRFNFLAVQIGSRRSSAQEQVRGRAREIAAKCQQEIRQAWGEIELLRYRPMLEAVLLTGLSAKTKRVLALDADRSLVSGDDDHPDEQERDHTSSDICNGARCDDRCCDCCYCPSDSDCRCCGECCGHGCYRNDVGRSGGDCSSGDGSGCDCSDGGCYRNDVGCSGGDCSGGHNSGCDCSGGGCGNCDCGSGDSSGCPCCGCDCNPGDCSGCDCGSCDCGNCDCSGCDCNCSS
jgi:hypothetical protein